MPTYTLECAQCHVREDVRHGFDEADPTVCAACGAPSLQRVYHVVPAFIRGAPLVNGEVRLRQPVVTRERDGSETVAGTLRELATKERERAEAQTWLAPDMRAQLARRNVLSARKTLGCVPGTQAAAQADAMDARPRL